MNLHTELPVLLILFSPLLAAIISLAGKYLPSRYSELPAFVIWLIGSLLALRLSLHTVLAGGALQYSLGGWAEPLGISLEVNGVTWIATLTDVLIASAAWLCTRKYRQFNSLFYFFFFMALFSLQGVLCTRDIFNLFVWFEVLSLSSFVLISYDRSIVARLAAIRYLLISSTSILLFLVGVWIMYRMTGVLSLEEISLRLAEITSTASVENYRPAIGLAVVLMTGGILTRAAVVPFHTWLPDAHSAAPYQVSALLSGFVIKAPMLALWKIFSFISLQRILYGLIWVGAVCALWGVLAAMVQKDAKKLLGYHSVSQMGYIVAAFGAGGEIGRSAALFYIIAHALFKSLLFFTVGNVTTRAGTRDVYKLRGLVRRFPLQAGFYFIAAASIAGVPFFAGFTGKLLVAKSLYGHPAYTLLLLAGAGTAASFVKLSGIFVGRPSFPGNGYTIDDEASGDTGSGNAASGDTASTFLGMGIIAAGCLLMGILPTAVHGFLLRLAVSSAPGLSGTLEIAGSQGAILTPASPLSGWYSTSNLLKAFITLAAGFVISCFLLSTHGKKLSHRIRRLRVGLNGSLRLVTAGFVLLILFGTWGYW